MAKLKAENEQLQRREAEAKEVRRRAKIRKAGF